MQCVTCCFFVINCEILIKNVSTANSFNVVFEGELFWLKTRQYQTHSKTLADAKTTHQHLMNSNTAQIYSRKSTNLVEVVGPTL